MIMTKTGMIMEKTAGGMSCRRSEQVWNQNLWVSGHYVSVRILFAVYRLDRDGDTGGTVHVMLSLDDRDFIDEETATRSAADSH